MLRIALFLFCATRALSEPTEVLIDSGSYESEYFGGGNRMIRQPFYLSTRLVTSKEWNQFLKDTKRSFRLDYRGAFFPTEDEGYLRQSLRAALSYDPFPAVVYDFFMVLDFCNWKSRKDGLQEVYGVQYGENTVVPGGQTWHGGRVLRRATITVRRDANGYRLPTLDEYVAAITAGQDLETASKLLPDFAKAKNPEFYKAEGFGYVDSRGSYRYYETGIAKPDSLGFRDLIGAINVLLFDVSDYLGNAIADKVVKIDTISRAGKPIPISCLICEGIPGDPEARLANGTLEQAPLIDLYIQSAILAFGFRLCRNAP